MRESTCREGGQPGLEVGLSGEPDVESFEPGRRPQQQHRCLTARGRCPLDLSPEPLHPGPLQIVDGDGLGGGHQAERRVERTGVSVGFGGAQRPLRTQTWLRGQGGSALEEGCRGRHPAAGSGCAGHPIELRGDVVVGSGRRGRQMPHPTLAIGVLVRRRRERNDARHGDPPACRRGRRPTARADAGTAPARRSPAAAPTPRRPLRRGRRPEPARRATGAWRRRWGRRPPAARVAGSARAGRVCAAGSGPADHQTDALVGAANPPDSSARPMALGSSNSANGFPRVSATIRSRTRSSM